MADWTRMIIFQRVGIASYISTKKGSHHDAYGVKRIQMNYIELIEVVMGALVCMVI